MLCIVYVLSHFVLSQLNFQKPILGHCFGLTNNSERFPNELPCYVPGVTCANVMNVGMAMALRMQKYGHTS